MCTFFFYLFPAYRLVHCGSWGWLPLLGRGEVMLRLLPVRGQSREWDPNFELSQCHAASSSGGKGLKAMCRHSGSSIDCRLLYSKCYREYWCPNPFSFSAKKKKSVHFLIFTLMTDTVYWFLAFNFRCIFPFWNISAIKMFDYSLLHRVHGFLLSKTTKKSLIFFLCFC